MKALENEAKTLYLEHQVRQLAHEITLEPNKDYYFKVKDKATFNYPARLVEYLETDHDLLGRLKQRAIFSTYLAIKREDEELAQACLRETVIWQAKRT